METKFEIIDDKGVIHSGSHDEMLLAFDVMTNMDVEYSKVLVDAYLCDWTGDLKLVEVHAIYK